MQSTTTRETERNRKSLTHTISGIELDEIYNPNQTFGDGSGDEAELEQELALFGAPNALPTLSPPRVQNAVLGTQPFIAPSIAQMATFDGTTLLNMMEKVLAENRRLTTESVKRPRIDKDEEDEGEPSVKLHIPEGYDDGWTNINNESRNVRPFCGDWKERFKSLGRKAKPARDTLDWEPMGTLTVANATIKRMHDRGAIVTIKMFLPMNHDVSSRNAKISIKGSDGDFVRETLDYREPTEPWQIVEALTVYTMCLSRIWPDDWTGHALTSILTKYRWLSNCGNSRSSQVKILIDFINNVLSTNATFGRQNRQPASYAKIEEVMANRIWSRGINREMCQTGRDPWSSTPDGPRIPKREAEHTGPPSTYDPKQNQNNGKRGKGPGTSKGKAPRKEGDHCRGFNSVAGCNLTSNQCKFRHACSRSIDSNRFCNKTDHNADSHP